MQFNTPGTRIYSRSSAALVMLHYCFRITQLRGLLTNLYSTWNRPNAILCRCRVRFSDEHMDYNYSTATTLYKNGCNAPLTAWLKGTYVGYAGVILGLIFLIQVGLHERGFCSNISAPLNNRLVLNSSPKGNNIYIFFIDSSLVRIYAECLT